MIRTLFTITFLVYKKDRTCLPVFWYFSKFPLHLVHPCQPTYSFSVQCFQNFRRDFVFTSRLILFGFQSSYGRCHFFQYKNFLFPKLIVLHNSVVDALTGFNKSLKYSLHCERISFSSFRMFQVESLMKVVVSKLFPRKRQMVC